MTFFTTIDRRPAGNPLEILGGGVSILHHFIFFCSFISWTAFRLIVCPSVIPSAWRDDAVGGQIGGERGHPVKCTSNAISTDSETDRLFRRSLIDASDQLTAAYSRPPVPAQLTARPSHAYSARPKFKSQRIDHHPIDPWIKTTNIHLFKCAFGIWYLVLYTRPSVDHV